MSWASVHASMQSDLLILMPAYNESRAIGATLSSLKGVAGQVVVVDDGSCDDTARIAAHHGATVLRHVVNRGQGAALQTGFAYAGRSRCRYVCTFDADGQHDPGDIARMLQDLDQQNWDIVLGSRFKGKTVDMPRLRRLILKGAVLFTWVTAGVRLTDAHNGLRVMTVAAARNLNLRQDKMAYASELIEKIKALNLRYGETAVTIRYTDYSLTKGQKNFGMFKILKDLAISRLMG